jgi:uncharacterized membrane protein YphA (DoxX/SURF4 family)
MKLSHVPLRVATGAFILNAGLGKRELPPEAATAMQGMATKVVPTAGRLSPTRFGTVLSTGEIILGAALLAPFVPPLVAGAALTAFSGGLLTMWFRTPGMHEEGSIRPTQNGTAIAKDVWMLGSGLALVIDGLSDRSRKG